jgi:hypothetical protein
MDFSIRYSSIESMLEICKRIKDRTINECDVDDILNHEDYKFEFSRYKGRISEEEYKNYLLNLPDLSEKDIKNQDLRIHHKYYRDLLDNLGFFRQRYLN